MSLDRLVGYLVLTKQADGSWGNDWDGVVHLTLRGAEAEYAEAVDTLGPENVVVTEALIVTTHTLAARVGR